MTKKYIKPQILEVIIEPERLLADSETMDVGEGPGGNTPEVKADYYSSGQSNSFSWDDWDE